MRTNLPSRIFIFWIFVLSWTGCHHASPVEKYLQQNHDLSPEITLALANGQVVNGMTPEQVKLILDEPLIKEPPGKNSVERWIYRKNKSGVEQSEAYDPESAFPLGIGFVIPMSYRAQEIRVDFLGGKVCRIERVLGLEG